MSTVPYSRRLGDLSSAVGCPPAPFTLSSGLHLLILPFFFPRSRFLSLPPPLPPLPPLPFLFARSFLRACACAPSPKIAFSAAGNTRRPSSSSTLPAQTQQNPTAAAPSPEGHSHRRHQCIQRNTGICPADHTRRCRDTHGISLETRPCSFSAPPGSQWSSSGRGSPDGNRTCTAHCSARDRG